jgi:hypothetical protein
MLFMHHAVKELLHYAIKQGLPDIEQDLTFLEEVVDVPCATHFVCEVLLVNYLHLGVLERCVM